MKRQRRRRRRRVFQGDDDQIRLDQEEVNPPTQSHCPMKMVSQLIFGLISRNSSVVNLTFCAILLQVSPSSAPCTELHTTVLASSSPFSMLLPATASKHKRNHCNIYIYIYIYYTSKSIYYFMKVL